MNNTIKDFQSKEILFGKEGIERVKKGIDITCNAIKSTIGPCGKNAFIDSEIQPTITNDGVSIARAVKLKDPFAQMGAWLVNNTCDKTFDDVGDSTTTTATLLQAIVDLSLKRPENPIKIRKSLKTCGKAVDKWITDNAKEIKSTKDIEAVATISSESPEVGKLIADIIEKVGKSRPIRVEDGMFSETELEIVEGLETKVGYSSPLFITNESEGVAEMEDVLVFASDRQISSLPDIAVLLEMLKTEKITSLVFLVGNMDNAIKGTFALNKKHGLFNSLVIEVRGTELEDMAAASGATLISDSTGLKLKDVRMEHLGRVKSISSNARKTLIIGEGSEKTKQAIERLRKQATQTKNIYEAQYINKRADNLEGGIAVIKVGAPTDTEKADLKLKILNSVNATKSAIEEGIVEGGGMCLYRAANQIKGGSIGEEILKVALKAPLKNIVENAGEDYSDVSKRLIGKKGYNAYTNKAVDMFKEGIIDSAKATRCALANALSSASEFITAGVNISNLIETNDK